MDEREKIAQLLCKQTGSNENRECETCPFNGCIAQRQADALIAAGIRDITRDGYICMNGEVIVPTPNIYNKVADLLACPRIKEREIEEEERK